MYWRGKIIGLFFGLLILKSPLGVLIGLLVGHYFDKGLGSIAPNANHQQVFLDSLFSVMGYIAKSDGRVTEKEIHIARDMMSRLRLNESQRQATMRAFTRGKEPDFNLESTIAGLQNTYAHQPSQLKLFFTLQMQAAYGEGYMNVQKQQILQHIGHLLGFVIPFMGFDFGQGAHRQHRQTH